MQAEHAPRIVVPIITLSRPGSPKSPNLALERQGLGFIPPGRNHFSDRMEAARAEGGKKSEAANRLDQILTKR